MTTFPIKSLVYNRAKGYDVPTDYATFSAPLESCKTVAEAAEATYKELCRIAREHGQAETEVRWYKPEDNPHGEKQHVVMWESGPHDWAIGSSFNVVGPWGYTEPYYGFDLCFVEM